MRILYDILFFIFSLIYLPTFFMKGKHTKGFGSRFGYVPTDIIQKLAGQKVIWVHAVSVGEVGLAIRILNLLKEKFVGFKFVLTTTTSTGFEVASNQAHAYDFLSYFPIDFRFSVKRFIHNINPKAVIFMETEIWPNLIWELEKQKIPFFIMNGRISDKALPGYKAIQFFTRPLLRHFTGIAVQDTQMRDRFLTLGADEQKLEITGNIKFDWRPNTHQDDLLKKIKDLLKTDENILWIAGSTHQGEEEIIFRAYKNLQKEFPNLLLLMAPRHLTRLAAIETVATQSQIQLVRISDVFIKGKKRYDTGACVAFLLDQMGILASLYELADVVFVGGSLVPVGGHNLVEPAFFEKPIIFGPYMHNFKEMSGLFIQADAACVVNESDIEQKLKVLIQDKNKRALLGLAAKKILTQNEGALGKSMHWFLEKTKGSLLWEK